MTQTIVLGGGCFWCTEAVFQKLRGVVSVAPGYAGGSTKNPSYEDVCSGATGHAEAIRVEYDPNQLSLGDLLSVFFAVHDPTTKDRQGNDVGTQYRSAIYTTSDEQLSAVKSFIAQMDSDQTYPAPIVTDVRPLDVFYKAEEYHHNYFERNPEKAYCQAVINPKLEKFHKKYAALVKE